MSAVPSLAERAATLLDADPGLVRVIGRRNAAGDRAPAGPARAARGARALDAARARRARAGHGRAGRARRPARDAIAEPLIGPGDVIEPWGAAWVACTPVAAGRDRRAYLDAACAPGRRCRSARALGSRRRRRGRVADAGTLDERLAGAAVADRAALGRAAGRRDRAAPGARRARAEPDARRRGAWRSRWRSPRCASDGVGATRDGALWLRPARDRGAGARAAATRCGRAPPSSSRSRERRATTAPSCATSSTSCSRVATRSAPQGAELSRRPASSCRRGSARRARTRPAPAVRAPSGQITTRRPSERAMPAHERAQPGRIHEADLGQVEPDLVRRPRGRRRRRRPLRPSTVARSISPLTAITARLPSRDVATSKPTLLHRSRVVGRRAPAPRSRSVV